MTIKEQAIAIRDALEAWARENAGGVKVAGDPAHLVEMLRMRPGAPFCGILFDREDPRGERSELGKVDRVFKVVVSRGRGFRLDTGENLTGGSAGGQPLFDLAEQVRELVRQAEFDPGTTEGAADYQGIGAFEVQGFIFDAYEVRFSIGTQIPLAGEAKE